MEDPCREKPLQFSNFCTPACSAGRIRGSWPIRGPPASRIGAGEGNRTLVCSLGSCRSTIELHPRRPAPRRHIGNAGLTAQSGRPRVAPPARGRPPALVICPAGLRRGETSALKRPAERPGDAPAAAAAPSVGASRMQGPRRHDHDPPPTPPRHPAGARRHPAQRVTAKPPRRCSSPRGFVYDSAEQAEATFAGTDEALPVLPLRQPDRGDAGAAAGADRGRRGLPRHRHRHGGGARRAAVPAEAPATGVVAARALFGSCHWIVSTLLPRYGIDDRIRRRRRPRPVARGAGAARRDWCCWKRPSNPMLEIVDLPAVAELAHEAGAHRGGGQRVRHAAAATAAANSAPTSSSIRARSISTARAACSAAPCSAAEMDRRDVAAVHPQHRPGAVAVQCLGAAEGPGDAGACASTPAAAAPPHSPTSWPPSRRLRRVWYPARADHPQHALAMAQMTAGGTVVTFEVAGGKAAAFRVLNALRLDRVSNNLGDSKSLATHPATTTHMRIGAEERARLGITDGVIRLSVGLEDVARPARRSGAGARRAARRRLTCARCAGQPPAMRTSDGAHGGRLRLRPRAASR